MARIASFPPIEAPSAHTLILGTMPGTASLAAREYYAHPRNLFWTIFADLLEFSRAAPYAERVEYLRSAGFAIWDVLHSCERPGSLDSAIAAKSVIPNDFAGFFASHGHIDRVFFNGNGAATLYRRHVLPALGAQAAISYTRLPSTSPANAGISAATKRQAWGAVIKLGDKLEPLEDPTTTLARI